MLEQGTGEKQQVLITVLQLVRNVEPESIAVIAPHHGQPFPIQPEMRERGLQWQG